MLCFSTILLKHLPPNWRGQTTGRLCPRRSSHWSASSRRLPDGWRFLEMEISMLEFQEGTAMAFHPRSYDSRTIGRV